jgi:hypothetical protein
MTVTETQVPDRTTTRLGGGLLAFTALMTMVLVMHHPVLTARYGVTAFAAGVRPLAQMDRIVHGGLMAIFSVQALGFYIFSQSLGLRRPAVAAGFMAFVAGVVVMAVPTTLDGFVTPDLAEACAQTQGGCTAADASVLRLVATMIQNFTKVALVSMCLGTGAWSLALLSSKGLLTRGIGIVGLICAAMPASVLFFSAVYLQPANLAKIIASEVIWTLVVAGLMIFRNGRADAMKARSA